MAWPSPELLARYAEPHRSYHTWAHVEACLGELANIDGLSEADRRTLELALEWHDAIYDPHRSDNEERSAELAAADLETSGADPATISEVARLIRLTKGHQVEPGDRRGALMVSIDLSILGARPEAYDAYSRAVRKEYAFLPEEAFREGRAAILRRFLESPAIFPDPGLRDRFEAAARANLAREIAAFLA